MYQDLYRSTILSFNSAVWKLVHVLFQQANVILDTQARM